jgi:hypothetical protein
VPPPISARGPSWRRDRTVDAALASSILVTGATGCSLAAKAPVWETGDRWFESSHPDQFHRPQRRIAPAFPKRRNPGSSPGVGTSLGVAQSGQSAGFGSRRSSVRIRPSRPRGVGQQLSRQFRILEIAGASPAFPTISPRSSNGRAPVLHTGDGGSIPSRGTTRGRLRKDSWPFKPETRVQIPSARPIQWGTSATG